MARIRAVLFDYGNVLVRWDRSYLYRKLFADPAEMERFFAEVLTFEWHAPHDDGAPMAPRLPALIARHPQYEAEINAFHERYGETIDGEIEGSIALLDRLAGRDVPLGMLTNMPGDKQDVCLAHCSRLHHFKTIVVSGVEKISKPDPRIYRLALERLGSDAEETLFIDDSAVNIAGAAAIGLATHHFSTPDALGAALAEHGLLS